MDNMRIVGAISSAVLVIGMVAQVVRQWREGSSKGVSRWFPFAQFWANVGFAWYGISLKDPVVSSTGIAMALCSAAGFFLVLRHRHGRAPGSAGRTPPRDGESTSSSLPDHLDTHVGE